jgi:hypothetical protein
MKKLNAKQQFWVLACPFLILVIGGSLLLTEFTKPRFYIQEQARRFNDKEKQQNLRKGSAAPFSLQREYLRLQQDLNINDWELKPLETLRSRNE